MSYLDGKGNLESQGTGKSQPHYYNLDTWQLTTYSRFARILEHLENYWPIFQSGEMEKKVECLRNAVILEINFRHFPLIFTVPTAVQSLSDELLKYYQQVTRAILGDDPHLMKVYPRRACRYPVTLSSVLLLILFFFLRSLCWTFSQTPRSLPSCPTLYMSSVGYVLLAINRGGSEVKHHRAVDKRIFPSV